MFAPLTKLFNTPARKIDEMSGIIEAIHSFDKKMEKLSDEGISDFAAKLKKRYSKGETLDELLPESFALVREASKRSIGLAHYDVQLIAGIVFHRGMIAEQKTGEGKTLSATLPLFLNSLTDRGVHLVTVNDYLAQLGAGWMGPIYHLLGVSVSVIIHDEAFIYDPKYKGPQKGDDRLEHFRPVSRKEAYDADVTYGTNNEFGFDYLRDNMAAKLPDVVQRDHYFAIVDEADSILIDEARTPLIISATDTDPTQKYYEFAKLVTTLVKDSDYKVDEKLRTVALTDLGIKRVEKKLGYTNLYEESFEVIHHLEAALKALTLFKRDKEYIVRDGEVIIVDEHTGRLMFGRRYSDGLHQAIEAKENAKIQQESRTLATISLQNYFRLYEKLSGMSGTAITESEEFHQIYKIDVLPIPTHKKVIREDHSDLVYKTARAKYSAIVNEVEELHKQNRPILIGTRSIDHNQVISDLLSHKNIPHQVLNAKNNEKEAFIIADAGRPGAITVATNIAGRGVDIILGGSKPEVRDFAKASEYKKAVKEWHERHEEVVRLGGLHIVGTERHESRRIDNQLRGRAGRQGDPGSSRFYIALEDDIMRIFGGDKISNLMGFMKMDENQPIEAGLVGKAIEQAQIKVEGFFFDQRKRLVELDDVMNKQREVIYKRRRKMLELLTHPSMKEKGEALPKSKEQILSIIDREIENVVLARASEGFTNDEIDAIVKEFIGIIPFDDNSQKELREHLLNIRETTGAIEAMQNIAHTTYEQREQTVGSELMRELESFTILQTVDEHWMDHLDAMEDLREGIWLRGDKQAVDSAYKKEAFQMFEALVDSIDASIARKIFRTHVGAAQPQTISVPASKMKTEHKEASLDTMTEAGASKPSQIVSGTATKGSLTDLAQALAGAKGGAADNPGVAVAKIGRNDPCPCGSGKKYKKCHGK
ncbi:MAG TPA: preprotein translocase subunit SecA [Patescibacteria group bacterium]|nr:preprotein translocase subunit SecA [Patescibacteria group bacterium]